MEKSEGKGHQDWNSENIERRPCIMKGDGLPPSSGMKNCCDDRNDAREIDSRPNTDQENRESQGPVGLCVSHEKISDAYDQESGHDNPFMTETGGEEACKYEGGRIAD